MLKKNGYSIHRFAVLSMALLFALLAASCGNGDSQARWVDTNNATAVDPEGRERLIDDVFEEEPDVDASIEMLSEDEGFVKVTEEVCGPVPQTLIDAILPGATFQGDLLTPSTSTGARPTFERSRLGTQVTCKWGVGDRTVILGILFAPATNWREWVTPTESFDGGNSQWYLGDNSIIVDGGIWPIELSTTRAVSSSVNDYSFRLPSREAAAAVILNVAPRVEASYDLICSIRFDGPDARTKADALANANAKCGRG